MQKVLCYMSLILQRGWTLPWLLPSRDSGATGAGLTCEHWSTDNSHSHHQEQKNLAEHNCRGPTEDFNHM